MARILVGEDDFGSRRMMQKLLEGSCLSPINDTRVVMTTMLARFGIKPAERHN